MLKDRFIKARNVTSMSQARLAELAGVSQTAIYKIESGETVNPRRLEKYAEIMGVDPAWLQYGVGNEPVTPIYSQLEASVKLKDSDRIEDSTSTYTNLSHTHDQMLGIPYLDKDSVFNISESTILLMLKNTQEVKAVLEVKDDAMNPSIASGDIILISNCTKTLLNDRIYVFRIHGNLVVRRVIIDFHGCITLTCDNPNKNRFRDLPITQEEAQNAVVGLAACLLFRSFS